MTRLISSELLKLRSTRTAVALIASVVGLVVLIGLIASITADFEKDDVQTVDLLGIAGFAQVFALILGVLAVTTEFRHGTITPTLTVAPDRVRLVMAKLVAHVLAGLLLGVLAVGLTTAIVLVVLSSRGIDSGLTNGEITNIVIGLVLATALWAALGVGLGALVRNQVGAIIGSLVYLFVLENLLNIAAPLRDPVAKFGFGGLINGLTSTGNSGDDHPPLHQLPAGLVLAAYCAIFLIAGIAMMKKRDITA